jgi:hypothetical protein
MRPQSGGEAFAGKEHGRFAHGKDAAPLSKLCQRRLGRHAIELRMFRYRYRLAGFRENDDKNLGRCGFAGVARDRVKLARHFVESFPLGQRSLGTVIELDRVGASST